VLDEAPEKLPRPQGSFTTGQRAIETVGKVVGEAGQLEEMRCLVVDKALEAASN
jgi:hypothetical protein